MIQKWKETAGWVKTILVIIGTFIGIVTGSWALTTNISSSVSSKVEDTAREVIQDELSAYSEDLKNVRSKEIDEKIRIHKLESEIDLNNKLDAIREQNAEIKGTQAEILRRLPK